MTSVPKILAIIPSLFLSTLCTISSTNDGHHGFTQDICDHLLNYKIRNEIASYQSFVDLVLNKTTSGDYKGQTWSLLNEFADKFGVRALGSENLENSINYVVNSTRKDKVCVCLEKLQVPKWQRGNATLALVEPFRKEMKIMALGLSVGTTEELMGQVVVVDDFLQLEKQPDLAQDKIVLFNTKFTTLAQHHKYQRDGANIASIFGATAALIRSSSSDSLSVGDVEYGQTPRQIPAAVISAEDADRLQHLASIDEPIKVALSITAKLSKNTTTSRNTIVKLVGREQPEKSVLISGHLDSLDVPKTDDGVGALISWLAVKLLKDLRVRPRRTIQGILWTGEQVGYLGAKDWVRKHFEELKDVMIALEADDAGYAPVGLQFKGGKTGGCILKEVMKLFANINATKASETRSEYSIDLDVFSSVQVPTASLITRNYKNFQDVKSMLDSEDLDKNLGVWASLAYILANLSIDLPRDDKRLSIFANYTLNSFHYEPLEDDSAVSEAVTMNTPAVTTEESEDFRDVVNSTTDNTKEHLMVEDEASGADGGDGKTFMFVHLIVVHLLIVLIY